ncbi:DUF2975 domain-containing protein [Spirillospora sp. NPDC048911]|uniref:DUF2975 domain-containing protein n=1 Tax=Spirillospora sp. NPDC048911 TaxID=3364527 RepID=UPI003716C158
MRLKTGRKQLSPFEPFATIISAVFGLTVGFLVLAAVMAPFSDNVSFAGSGDGKACVEDRLGNTYGVFEAAQLKPGVKVAGDSAVEICMEDADIGLLTLDVLTGLPAFVLYLGAMALLWRLVRGAAALGPFHRTNARRLRFTGWWLLAGGVLAHTCEYVAETWLVHEMYRPGKAPDLRLEITALLPWSLLLTGIGLLTVARILEVGVRMHEDLEGTV